MNRLVKASMTLATNQKALCDLLDTPAETRGESFDAQLETAKTTVQAAHTEVELASLAEPDIRETRETTEDAEGAELRELKGKVQFSQYIAASGARRGVLGAEKELNQALGMGELDFPLEMLVSPEERAAINGDADTNQGTWLDRVFADTGAMRLGIQFRGVPSGIAAYPVTTSGRAAQQRQRAEAATTGTLAVSVTELKPTRHAVRIKYSIEDVARLPGLADAIMRDMRMEMVEDIDRSIFVGAAASGTEADIDGLTTASITEATLTQANKVKAAETLAEFVAYLDGKHAASPADLNIVAAVGANKLWLSTIHNSSVDNQTLAQFLRENGLTWSVRGDIEANSLNDDFGCFVSLARGLDGAGLVPVWDAGQMITDPYSDADAGEVNLTLSYLWNFGIPRTDSFRRLKFVT